MEKVLIFLVSILKVVLLLPIQLIFVLIVCVLGLELMENLFNLLKYGHMYGDLARSFDSTPPYFSDWVGINSLIDLVWNVWGRATIVVLLVVILEKYIFGTEGE